MATANSSLLSKIVTGLDIIKVIVEFMVNVLSRLNNKCPATMFATNRMASVNGRIRFLVSSIITMKFIRAIGVPFGIIWAIIFFVLLTHPNIMILVHIISVVGKIIIM